MESVLNIAVMLGGPSAEREVSLKTGGAAARALRELGHRVTEIDPKHGSFRLDPATDVAFLALHGSYGEDGTVQHQLEALGVPYTGCGVEASRVAFDKVLTKLECVKAGLETARFFVAHSASEKWPAGWEPPAVLKPVRQGSSVGLCFLDDVAQWPKALAEALSHGSEVLVESKIAGRETTVAILDGRALPIVEIRPKQGAYDYRNKYTSGATEYFCPADFDAATTARVQSAALGIFHAIGGRDYGRIDIIVKPDGTPVILEVNTLPGMTETSLLPKAALAAGISYGQLCQKMVDLALLRKRKP